MGPLFAFLLAASSCEPLADVAAKIDFDLRPMPEEAIQPMLAFHNAQPPVSEDFWTKAVYGTTDQGVGIIMWMRGDEVCVRDVLSPEMWKRLLPLIEGQGA